MNGAIVVSSVTKEGKSWDDVESWKDSAKEVIKFWKEQEYQWSTIADILDMDPLSHYSR